MVNAMGKEGLSVKELAEEYKKSITMLNKRITELQKVKDFLTAHTKDPEKDPEVIELKDRLKPLVTMLNDLREVTREIEHYYDRSWWRSEKYTCNARKSRRFIYSRPTGYLLEHEPTTEGTDETYVGCIDGYIDEETETDY